MRESRPHRPPISPRWLEVGHGTLFDDGPLVGAESLECSNRFRTRGPGPVDRMGAGESTGHKMTTRQAKIHGPYLSLFGRPKKLV